MPNEVCVQCGKEKKRAGQLCSACYARAYYHDPVRGPERRAKNIERVKAYTKAHPDKRRQWVINWKRKTQRMWG